MIVDFSVGDVVTITFTKAVAMQSAVANFSKSLGVWTASWSNDGTQLIIKVTARRHDQYSWAFAL